MKTRLSGVVVLLAALFMTGCASNLMKPSASQQVAPPAADKAKVVFMRTSFVASAIGVEMFDVTGGDVKFIGSLPMGNKIVYETSPGEKVFMAYGAAADFMKAKLDGGKIYYSIVRPNWGTGGFAPTPIRTNGSSNFHTGMPEFAEWKSSTELIEMNQDAPSWFVENKAKYEEIYKTYWAKFSTKTPEQQYERTMLPTDGMKN